VARARDASVRLSAGAGYLDRSSLVRFCGARFSVPPALVVAWEPLPGSAGSVAVESNVTAPVAVVVSPGGGYGAGAAAVELNVIPVAGAVVVAPERRGAGSFMLATMAALAPPVANAASAAARTTIRWLIARLMSMMSKRSSRARR
jgi:hypothetical protein